MGAKVQMHPSNPKRHATLNHVGDFRFDRKSRCPCKNGPCCDFCNYCLGCSCRCHSWFTMRTRLCNMKDEELLLQTVKETARRPASTEDSKNECKVFDVLESMKYLHERLKDAGDAALLSKEESGGEGEGVKVDGKEGEGGKVDGKEGGKEVESVTVNPEGKSDKVNGKEGEGGKVDGKEGGKEVESVTVNPEGKSDKVNGKEG